MKTIGVVIPAHEARFGNGMLTRALDSVQAQTHKADEIYLQVDGWGNGAGATRQKGLLRAAEDLVAFIDSDDEWLPYHLETLRQPFEADPDVILTYSWFEPVGQVDPFKTGDGRSFLGLPFNPHTPHHTTVTTMVDREVALAVGGFPTNGEGSTPACGNEDWIFLLRMCEYAITYQKKIFHIPRRTWRWHNGHGGNSGGLPGRGDA